MRSFRSLAAFACAALLAIASRRAFAIRITEITIPGVEPEMLVAAPDGSIWFSEYATGHIGVMRDGVVSTRYVATAQPAWIAMEWNFTYGPIWSDASLHQVCNRSRCFEGFTGNAEPRGMARTPQGTLWIVEHAFGRLAYKQPGEVVIHEIGFPFDFDSGDGLSDIAYGMDGNLWITEQDSNRIARVSLLGASLEVTHFTPPTASSHPLHIVSGPDGKIWFTERGANKIGRIDPLHTGTGILEFAVPTPGSSPNDITVGPDGALWFTELLAGKVGRIAPTGQITEYPLPSGAAAGPSSIALGGDGDLWVALYGVKKFARVHVNYSGDVNDDGARNVGDVFYLINYLFAGGPAPK